MDDRQFTEKTAKERILTIEGPTAHVRNSDLYPHLSEWVNRECPQSILDVGCGQGVCSEKLMSRECSYVGVDPSTFLIDRAKKLYQQPNKNFIVGNAYSLPFEDEVFDAAISIALWHLLEDKFKASLELSRILRNRGAFLIATANPECYDDWTKNYESFSKTGQKLEGKSRSEEGSVSVDTFYLHTLEEITTSLQRAGLGITRSNAFRTVIVLEGEKEC